MIEAQEMWREKCNVCGYKPERKRSMRTKTVVMLVIMMTLLFGAQAFAQAQLQIQNIQSQIVGSPDSAGNVQFSVTADALNPSMYGTEFSVQVQGLNGSGSSVTTVTLWGRVGGRETGTLTGQGSLPQATYDSIANWAPMN
jgi:hypothetical protein